MKSALLLLLLLLLILLLVVFVLLLLLILLLLCRATANLPFVIIGEQIDVLKQYNNVDVNTSHAHTSAL